MGARPSLRTELLFNLAFLAAAALLLGVGTVLLVAALAPDRALPFILTTVALDVVVFIFFGRYLVSRLVLRPRSEEHTSELQSHSDLVCRLLLEKKKKKHKQIQYSSANGNYLHKMSNTRRRCSPR